MAETPDARKRNRKYPPKETPVMTAMKGWQVSRYFPGTEETVESWFDYRCHRQFSAFLLADAEHEGEALVRVRWVGF